MIELSIYSGVGGCQCMEEEGLGNLLGEVPCPGLGRIAFRLFSWAFATVSLTGDS
jgi:hypothetical protein